MAGDGGEERDEGGVFGKGWRRYETDYRVLFLYLFFLLIGILFLIDVFIFKRCFFLDSVISFSINWCFVFITTVSPFLNFLNFFNYLFEFMIHYVSKNKYKKLFNWHFRCQIRWHLNIN